MVKITASDFRGLYAIIPTPATIDASASQAEATVDLTETRRLIEALLHDGVDALIALGTTGECATLVQAEYETFVDAVLQTTNGRTSTIIGTTALGTHEAIRRAKFAAARGAHAMLLGLPMWQPCTMDMALRHYAAVAEACPNLPIMVYANSRAFRFDYTDPGFWSRIRAVAPSVVAAKFSRAKALLPCLEASEGAVHFLPHDDAVHAFYELSPQTTTACWANVGIDGSGAVARADRRDLGGRCSTRKNDCGRHCVGEPAHENPGRQPGAIRFVQHSNGEGAH